MGIFTKDKNTKKSILADSALLLVALIWGGGFVAVKDALNNNISPFYLMSMRFLIGSVILSSVFYKKFKKITIKEIKAGALIGIFLFGGFAFQTIGLKYTVPGKQAFITGTYVVMVPFLEWIIYRKNPGLSHIIAAVMTCIGIGLLTLNQQLSVNIGDILTLICAVFFALHIIAIGKFSKGCDTIILSIVQLWTAGFISLACAVIFEKAPSSISFNAFLGVMYLAVFSTMLAFFMQTVAQKYASPAHAAIILSQESLFGCIFSVILLGENFTVKMVSGCVIIFFAISMSVLKSSK